MVQPRPVEPEKSHGAVELDGGFNLVPGLILGYIFPQLLRRESKQRKHICLNFPHLATRWPLENRSL